MKWTVFLIFCIFLVSCGGEDSTEFGIVKLEELMNNPGEVKLSEIVDTIEYIRLETSEESLIGQRYTSIRCTPSYIFISAENSPLKVFKRDGSFLHTIGEIGRGPGEYSRRYTFNYDQEEDEVLILDSFRGEIRRYGIGGTFHGDLKGEGSIASFGLVAAGKICVAYRESVNDSTGIYNYALLDRNGDILNKYLIPCNIFTRLPIEGTDKFMGYEISSTMYSSGKHLLIDTKQNDTIFALSEKGELLMPFRWDAGKFKSPQSRLASGARKENLEKYFTFVLPARFGSDWFLTYKYEGESHYALILDNGKLKYLGTVSIPNDFDGGRGFWPYSLSISGKEYISSYDPVSLKKWLSEGAFDKENVLYPELNKRLKSLIESLDENDNPLVRVVTLKEKR